MDAPSKKRSASSTWSELEQRSRRRYAAHAENSSLRRPPISVPPTPAGSVAAGARTSGAGDEGDVKNELVFEDPYGDDIEEEDSEDFVDEDDEEDDGDEEESADAEDDDANDNSDAASRAAASASSAGVGAGAAAGESRRSRGGAAGAAAAAGTGEPSEVLGQDVWRPGQDALEAGEELDFDPSAYVTYHSLSADWPCLSFDVVPDRLGVGRTRFPMTMTLVAGTQADKPANNRLLLMRLSSINKTQLKDDASESSDDTDDDSDDELDTDDDPVIDVQRIVHATGGVNRVRVMPQQLASSSGSGTSTVATWCDSGRVHVWDVRAHMKLLDAAEGKGAAAPISKGYGPLQTFSGHSTEGYAIDWSGVVPGRLLTGDCAGAIHVWDPLTAPSSNSSSSSSGEGAQSPPSSWTVCASPFSGHSASVEDLQWSPNEATVFASCSADRTLRIWDTRSKARTHQLSVTAHASDANVISWSRLVTYLLASGADDGSFRVWDLRNFKGETPIAHFAWHTKPVTSIEWSYDDENVIAVGSADDTVTIWDMSLEQDEDAEMALLEKQANAAGLAESDTKAKGGGAAAPLPLPSTRDSRLKDIPPQLLFIHAGQQDVKEVHWHKQIPGMLISTAADGFNLFKPDLVVTK